MLVVERRRDMTDAFAVAGLDCHFVRLVSAELADEEGGCWGVVAQRWVLP